MIMAWQETGCGRGSVKSWPSPQSQQLAPGEDVEVDKNHHPSLHPPRFLVQFSSHMLRWLPPS